MSDKQVNNPVGRTAHAAQQRNRVNQLVRFGINADLDQALREAREINLPWYASQALSYVAAHAPADEVIALTTEAQDRLAASPDPYTHVAGAAWTLAVLADRGHVELAATRLTTALTDAKTIKHDGSRAEALMLLFTHLHAHNHGFWKRILEALAEFAGTSPRHWRHDRALRDITIWGARRDPDLIRRVLAVWPDCRHKRAALARI